MIEKEALEKILTYAVLAPSGDNSQPWKFSIPSQNIVQIWNIPGKDNPILNYQQTGSYVAHGALIQNIRIAAAAQTLSVSVKYFPGEKDCVAEITFFEKKEADTRLYETISNRSSNRKHYSKKPLSESDKKTLLLSTHGISPSVSFVFSKDAVDKNEVGKALATMEDIALQVPELHHLFFKDILWDKKGNESGIEGLYIKSLELPPPAQFAMRILKHWKVTDTLNRSIGLSKKIAAQMASVYRDSAIYGGIFINKRTPEAYVQVGELMQRVWLEATALGIAVQPVTGLMFLTHRAEVNDLTPIPKKFEKQILDSYQKVFNAFDAPTDSHLAFLMRFGHSKPASARSRRLPPVIV
ncbi:MAG: nitroreductase family protein [Candidatus Pacebacteria bacterium]|nr:nitroreductase family protein [Candidatus Paceibacterota bacterium]MBP9831965.1 nitroreductase family protein [Candidatus Paceibacterota bacterium]